MDVLMWEELEYFEYVPLSLASKEWVIFATETIPIGLDLRDNLEKVVPEKFVNTFQVLSDESR